MRLRFPMLVLTAIATAAHAGMMGVPTNLNANGSTSGTSVAPPGWLEVFGTGASNDLGDSVHQHRYFIEVTGTTLDVRIFDPGTSGERDFAGNNNNDIQTTYTLYNGSGTQIATNTIGNDRNTTQDRLVRLGTNGTFYSLTSNNANNTNFSGLTPGLFELRISTDNGDEGNTYGIDIRVSKADTTHYNVYTIGQNVSQKSSWFAGASSTTGNGTGVSNPITQPIIFYPYVDRGCFMNTTNHDADSTTSAQVTDVASSPATTTITLSGGTVHVELGITVESTAAQNTAIDNYGIWSLTYNPGTANAIDWRVGDFQGWPTTPQARCGDRPAQCACTCRTGMRLSPEIPTQPLHWSLRSASPPWFATAARTRWWPTQRRE